MLDKGLAQGRKLTEGSDRLSNNSADREQGSTSRRWGRTGLEPEQPDRMRAAPGRGRDRVTPRPNSKRGHTAGCKLAGRATSLVQVSVWEGVEQVLVLEVGHSTLVHRMVGRRTWEGTGWGRVLAWDMVPVGVGVGVEVELNFLVSSTCAGHKSVYTGRDTLPHTLPLRVDRLLSVFAAGRRKRNRVAVRTLVARTVVRKPVVVRTAVRKLRTDSVRRMGFAVLEAGACTQQTTEKVRTSNL